MCCFAAPGVSLLAALFTRPLRVRGTRIYARRDGEHQLLAYAMNLRARGDVAMILPLPVRHGADEADLEFVDLSPVPDLFDLLGRAFDAPLPKRGGLRLPARPPLAVRRVGAFEASFVPGIADFDRLDPRFRLPDSVWSALPVQGFGFAVFKLHATAGAADVHPMAFRFRTRDPSRLFFPTLHVHDGEAHPTARFDHALYYQREAGVHGDERPWSTESIDRAAERSAGLVHPSWPMARATLSGRRANVDTWMAA